MSEVPTYNLPTNPRRLEVRAEASAATAREAAEEPIASTEADSQRNAAAAWLASLSAPGCLHGLARHAPDIANQLAESWDDISATALLLEQLLVSDDVLSLSPIIASDLLKLYEYHVRCRLTDAPSTTWELPVSGLHDFQPTASCGSHV